MRKKLHIKVGDTVKVIAGNEKGNTGTVREIFRDKDRAIVDGLNMVKKHRKPTAQNPEGERIETEAAIHISNLMVVGPKGVASRTGRKKDENGKSVRYFKTKKNEEETK